VIRWVKYLKANTTTGYKSIQIAAHIDRSMVTTQITSPGFNASLHLPPAKARDLASALLCAAIECEDYESLTTSASST
jgi:hypothetical protein